jgi:hypothetical protein
MKIFGTRKMSSISSLTKVPLDLDPVEKTDYLKSKIIYEKFWTKC